MKTLKDEVFASLNVRNNLKGNLTCNVPFSFSFWLCSLSNNNLLTDVWLRLYCAVLFISLVEGFLAGSLSEGVGDTLGLCLQNLLICPLVMFFSVCTIVAADALMKPDEPCIISHWKEWKYTFLGSGWLIHKPETYLHTFTILLTNMYVWGLQCKTMSAV